MTFCWIQVKSNNLTIFFQHTKAGVTCGPGSKGQSQLATTLQ